MNQQFSQGYLEPWSRKRPSPAFTSDDSNDATNDPEHRPGGNKVPKLSHYDSYDTYVDFQNESLYGVNSGSQSLSDRGDSWISSPNPVLDTWKDDLASSSDAMTDVLQEKTEPTCCFGMVRGRSTSGIHIS